MEKLEKDLNALKQHITKLFENENSGHDITHLENVLEFAKTLQKKEGGDLYVICLSALLHDIHRLLSTTNHYVTPKESLPAIKQILDDFDIDKKQEILFCIEHHEEKQSSKSFNIETLILQDADALDALGHRGLERTIKYCKTHKIPTTNFDFDLDCEEYIPDINPISTCHYVYRTLIPQCENLNTKTAQQLASKSSKIFKDFIDEQYKNHTMS